MESAEPNSIIPRSEIEENDAHLLTSLEKILDVLGEEGYLVRGGLPAAEACLLFGSFRSITSSRRTWRRRSKILYGVQSRAMGQYPFGSSSDLLGFRRAMTLARHHIFGSLDVRKQEQNDRSHSVALLPRCRMNSGRMLSIPAALFGFRYLIANFISSLMNSPKRLASTLGSLLGHSLHRWSSW